MNFVVNSIRKYQDYLFIYILFFIAITIVFVGFGSKTDFDSTSYFYLFKGLLSYTLARPLGFPFLLYIASLFGMNIFPVTVFIINIALLSLSVVVLYIISKRVFFRKELILGFLFFLFFDYVTMHYVNYINPEIAVTCSFCICLLLLSRINRNVSIRYFLLLSISMGITTFVKPVFLYFPFCVFVYFVMLTIKKYLSLRQLGMFTILFIFTYVLSIFGWSYMNWTKYKLFTFSYVQEVNLTKKLMQYGMIFKGPEVVNGYPVKEMLKNTHTTNIYHSLYYLGKDYPVKSQIDVENSVYAYSKIILFNNFFEYFLKSVQSIPTILSDRTLQMSMLTSCSNIQPFYVWDTNIRNAISYICTNTYASIYTYTYVFWFSFINKILLLPLSILVTLVFIKRFIEFTNDPLDSGYYIFIYFSIIWMLIIFSMGAYENMERILEPIRYPIILLVFLALDKSIQIADRKK
jgi:4-amino-4-deoxy-L-arabinose transferase-like glycosyltransferase